MGAEGSLLQAEILHQVARFPVIQLGTYAHFLTWDQMFAASPGTKALAALRNRASAHGEPVLGHNDENLQHLSTTGWRDLRGTQGPLRVQDHQDRCNFPDPKLELLLAQG